MRLLICIDRIPVRKMINARMNRRDNNSHSAELTHSMQINNEVLNLR
jgi:hypothetical protein